MTAWTFTACADTTADPGRCCVCRAPATKAVLTNDLREHHRCDRHVSGERVKTLETSGGWDE